MRWVFVHLTAEDAGFHGMHCNYFGFVKQSAEKTSKITLFATLSFLVTYKQSYHCTKILLHIVGGFLAFSTHRREANHTTKMTTTTNINHITAAIMFVRACGPVTKNSIANEIRVQVQGATKENCGELADKAIEHGLDRGWLEKYDEDSFCIACA